MCTARVIPQSVTISDAARDAILHELQAGPKRPTELLVTFEDRFADFVVKEAFLRLLDDGSLILTSDRQLKLSEFA